MKTFIVRSNFEREVKAIDKDDVYYQLFKDIEENMSTAETELSESLIIQEKKEQFRVAVCDKTKKEVVQILQEDNTWLCLHNETPEEDEREVKKFKQKNK